MLVEGDLRRLRRLAAESGWRVLLTVGLAHYDAAAAAREASAARRIFGGLLAGIEVGNEPDSYGRHALRTLPWTAASYETEVSSYRQAMARHGARLALAGPGVSGSLAFRSWGTAEARRQRPALLTGHHYPLRCDSVPPPTIEALLSERTRALEAVSLSRYLAVAHARQTGFRMDETNTVSCGGRPGISDTFASALWAAGYITQAMSAGVVGINLQGDAGELQRLLASLRDLTREPRKRRAAGAAGVVCAVAHELADRRSSAAHKNLRAPKSPTLR